jgi:lipopolysaccharide export system permease protein
MKILERYLLKEMAGLFAIVLGLFIFVLLLQKILDLVDLVVKGISIGDVAFLLLYLTPSLLIVTIPIALLAVVVMTFSRLSADNEIIATKASGVSLFSLMRPVLLFSILGLLVCLWLMLYALPAGNLRFKTTLFRMVRSKVNLHLKERTFIDTFDGLVLYVQEVLPGGSELRGVIISALSHKGVNQTIFAERGWLVADPDSLRVALHLERGAIHRGEGERYQVLTFRENEIQIDFKERLARGQEALKGNREMGLGEMREKLQRLKQPGGVPYCATLVEYHKKFSVPFACLILGLIGPPLGISNRRSGRAGGLIISIPITLVYYLLLTMGQGLGTQGRMQPWLAMWLPNMVLGALGVLMILTVNREASPKAVAWVTFLADWGAARARKWLGRQA